MFSVWYRSECRCTRARRSSLGTKSRPRLGRWRTRLRWYVSLYGPSKIYYLTFFYLEAYKEKIKEINQHSKAFQENPSSFVDFVNSDPNFKEIREGPFSRHLSKSLLFWVSESRLGVNIRVGICPCCNMCSDLPWYVTEARRKLMEMDPSGESARSFKNRLFSSRDLLSNIFGIKKMSHDKNHWKECNTMNLLETLTRGDEVVLRGVGSHISNISSESLRKNFGHNGPSLFH